MLIFLLNVFKLELEKLDISPHWNLILQNTCDPLQWNEFNKLLQLQYVLHIALLYFYSNWVFQQVYHYLMHMHIQLCIYTLYTIEG